MHLLSQITQLDPIKSYIPVCLSLWCVLLVTSTPKIVLGSLITSIYQSLLILWAKVDVSSSAPLSYMIDWEIKLLPGTLHFLPVCVCQQTLEPVWTKLCGWVGNGPVKVPLNFTGNLFKGADFLLFFSLCSGLFCLGRGMHSLKCHSSFTLGFVSAWGTRPKRETNRTGAWTNLSNGHEGVQSMRERA